MLEMRTIENIPSAVYDPSKTSTIFAEDMNVMKANIEELNADPGLPAGVAEALPYIIPSCTASDELRFSFDDERAIGGYGYTGAFGAYIYRNGSVTFKYEVQGTIGTPVNQTAVVGDGVFNDNTIADGEWHEYEVTGNVVFNSAVYIQYAAEGWNPINVRNCRLYATDGTCIFTPNIFAVQYNPAP